MQRHAYGPCVWIFAPGRDITTADLTTEDEVIVATGTSLAAPHVAGVAALYKGLNPLASTETVRLWLAEQSTKGVLTGVGRAPPTGCCTPGACKGGSTAVSTRRPGDPVQGPGPPAAGTAHAADMPKATWPLAHRPPTGVRARSGGFSTGRGADCGPGTGGTEPPPTWSAASQTGGAAKDGSTPELATTPSGGPAGAETC